MQTASIAERTGTYPAASPRRVPLPATEPPYEETTVWPAGRRVPAQDPLTQGSLALDLSDQPVRHERYVARHLSLVDQLTEECEDTFFAPQRTPRVQLPHPKPWCGRFVQALVEVLAGERPPTQLMRWTTDSIFVEISRRARLVGQTRGPVARSRARGAGRRVPVAHGRLAVRSVHIFEPADGVAEAAVHVQHGSRSRAVAIRIEGLDGRWRCTAIQIG